jgi:ABC-type multidrug transport system fused ATPase/permease subunit
MGEFEAIGDAVTGGIVGRAVEPKAGEAGDGHTHETHCLNCGALLAGPYCHECGQHAHVHRTLSAFFHDFLHGVLHFEGKIWRTLPLLVWKPGDLTRGYIDGQRARFVSPVALFLFTVFLMFAIMGLTGGLDSMAQQASQSDVESEISEARADLAEVRKERAEAVNEGRSTAKIDARIRSAQMKITKLGWKPGPKIETSAIQVSNDMPGWIRDAAGKAAKNPELLIYKLKTNAYKFSWALIPISVPFVWLMFPFSRRFRLYDHTVFVTYSLCFMMLLLVTATLVEFVAPPIASLAWFIPPIHMYRQLRGTYGVGRLGAAWRTFALTILAFIAVALFAALLVALGAFD